MEKDSTHAVLKTIDYAYDVFDRRLQKTVTPAVGPAEVEQYAFDGDSIVLRFENGNLASRYLHGPVVDQVFADEQVSGASSTVYWPLTDNLGTVRDLVEYDAGTDTTSVANHITYDAFGGLVSETNSAIDHLFGYTGREVDEESDLMYYRARYYDPGVGRFVSEDPIGFAAGDVNLSRYVGNGSTNATDPSGLEEEDPPKPRATSIGTANADFRGNPFIPMPELVQEGAQRSPGAPQTQVELLDELMSGQGSARALSESEMREFMRQSNELFDSIKECVPEALDWTQNGLDAAGFIPFVGAVADGLNAAISLGRGRYTDAGLSTLAAFFGGFTVVKHARRAMNWADFERLAFGHAPNKATFRLPWSEGNWGTRVVDDFVPSTGTIQEATMLNWSCLDLSNPHTDDFLRFSEKLKQAELDGWLLRNDPRVNEVIWYGTEPLPTTGRAAELTRLLEENGITYRVIEVP